MTASSASFAYLPDEVLLYILSFVDYPELLSISRTNHHFRALSLDPVLHAQRFHEASERLSWSLLQRPSLSSLLPPASTIYLSTTHVLARKLSRQLVSIRLNRNLARRPPAASLVKYNILPEECCSCDRATGEVIWGGGVAPGLVEVKRKVEKERVKDGLRAWLERKAARVLAQESDVHGASNNGDAAQRSRISVRPLVRRFTTAAKVGPLVPSYGFERRPTTDEAPPSPPPAPPPPPPIHSKWQDRRTGARKKSDLEPTRAHVNRLRKFWEGLAKG